MQKKTEEHIFQGMQRDMSVSKQKAEYLWDAHNIRLTARHGETLLSMTNERGTKKISNISITGVVLGYCVLGEYLTVFTKAIGDVAKPDYICRITKTNDTFVSDILYNGHLNFDFNHPIECLGVYENVDIQKVYWTDGINQPRLINITKQDVTESTYIDTSFDFVPTLDLNDSIQVVKTVDSAGIFAAGVIQYAVTYYNKYGQESNVSVISPLIPTSYTQRAGSPEDTIGNAFKVTVKNPDVHFEYLRLYSIFRSSKDTTPVCKRVADVKLGYGGTTSDDLYISDDKEDISYAQITGHPTLHNQRGMFTEIKLTPISDYARLTSVNIAKESSQITIDNHVFEANHYWHFTKSEYPNLIIRDIIYNEESEDEEPAVTYFTWGDECTDIYVSDGWSSENQILPFAEIASTPSSMCAASAMHYNTLVLNDRVIITDNGTIGDDVDYNELLFVGGEEITAGTLTQKDGTMFLGNINIKRPQIQGVYDIDSGIDHDIATPNSIQINGDGSNLVNAIRNNTGINASHRVCSYPLTMSSSMTNDIPDTYRWGNSLNAKDDSGYSTNVGGFKYNDHYRLGLQFQYKTGKWSQPVFIKDEICNNVRPSISITDNTCTHTIPTFTATLEKAVGQYMMEHGYLRVRSVVCFPTLSDQLIICQGILNPTVYSIGHRHTHTPDIQSSWFFRPVRENGAASPNQAPLRVEPDDLEGGDEGDDTGNNDNTTSQDIDPDDTGGGSGGSGESSQTGGNPNINADRAYEGAYIQYKDDHFLYSGMTRGGEIQTAPRKVGSDFLYNDIPVQSVGVPQKFSSLFAVDSSYVTMHSPEFEFNDSFYAMDFDTISCCDAGIIKIASNHGDIHILTTSTTVDPDSMGFFHTTIHSVNSAKRIVAGLFYMDKGIRFINGEGDTEEWWKNIFGHLDNTLNAYLVYPWHRTGSLNNDTVRTNGDGIRTAMLGQKKLTNLMFCEECLFYNAQQSLSPSTGGKLASDDDIRIFNSDQISLIKINKQNYYGNVDQVLTPPERYPIIGSNDAEFNGPLSYKLTPDSNGKIAWGSSEPVQMKYKSTPHAVIHTSEPVSHNDNSDQTTYPYLHFAELRRDANAATDFGGLSRDAIHANIWYPAGPAVRIGCDENGTALTGEDTGKTRIPFWYGDTYYQRYDCLKTYPFTDEDTNSIIEIGSFMVETKINLDGRYDKNRGSISNFMLNPTNFNLINPVYSQMDNFFNYRILDEDYYELSKYPTMVTWTGYKNNAAEVDKWTNITLANTLEMDGTKGKVNAVRVNSDQLYCFQNDAVGQILFNSRVQISPSDGVPIEISNNYKVDGNRYISTSIGCQNKWSIVEGIDGLYFIDNNTESLYLLGGQSQLKSISAPLNMSYWFITQDCGTPWIQHYWAEDGETAQQGIRCFYDSANADLYICTPEETLCYSEKLGQFISFFNYHNVIGMFNIDSDYYALNYGTTKYLDDDELPSIDLWGMFQGVYNSFFDEMYPSDFTFISNENPLNDKIFTNIELRGDFRYWIRNEINNNFNSLNHMVDHRRMFDTVRVWDEYQDTGDVDLRFIDDTISNMKKKFRIWRMDIPRDKDNPRQRIRNTWAKVKFTMNNPISIMDLVDKVTPDFIVWDGNEWIPLDLRNTKTNRFFYNPERDLIEETNAVGTVLAMYQLSDNVLKKIVNNNMSPYAYRKIHDMEIHDIGVVYFV